MFVASCGLGVVLIVVLGLLFAGLVVTLVMWFVGVAFRVVVVTCCGDLDCVVYRCVVCGFDLLFASLFVRLVLCLWIIVYDSWFRLVFYRFVLDFD